MHRMTPLRIAHISDTHLSREKPWFAPNLDAIVARLSARPPDLIINTGDIALDGVERTDDLAFGRERHAAFDAPILTVPGNHDLGDNPWTGEGDHSITDARLACYRDAFGDDFWLADAGSWALLGLDAQVFGSGLAAEREQWAFLESVPARVAGRFLAVFLHKPLFDAHVDEDVVTHRYVLREHRHRLLGILRATDVRLVASGHVHQYRHRTVDGVEHCWAPSTAYVLPDRRQPRIGVKRVGYVEYTLGDGSVDVTLVDAPEIAQNDLDDFPLAYAP